MKTTRPLLMTALLGAPLLAPFPAVGGDLVINPGQVLDSVFYENMLPDQITNYGTLNNHIFLGNYSWISNLGTLNNLAGVIANTGTVYNHGGGVINNGALSGSPVLFDNQSQITTDAGSTINNYQQFNSGNISNFGTLVNHAGTGILAVTDGVATYSGGSLTNNGAIDVQAGAAITNSGTTTNAGSLDSQGELWNYAAMTNQGSLISRFYMDNHGTFDNQGGATLENIGTFWNHGQFSNAGEITSTSWFSNADVATFTNTGTIDNQHNLRNYGTFDNQGDITSDTLVLNEGTFGISGSLTGAGNYEQNAGTTTVDGLLEAVDILINGGVLGGSGTVRGNVIVGPGGEVNPGNSPGTLTVQGDFLLDIGGLLTLEVGGTGIPDFDRLIVSGNLDLFGEIRIDLLPGFLLSDFLANFDIGDLFRVGDATTNAPITDPLLFAGASFSVFDGAGVADLWLRPDGTWNDTVPSSPTPPAPAPAPAVLWLMGIGLAGMGLGRRRRTRSESPSRKR